MAAGFRKRLFAWFLKKGEKYNRQLYGEYKKKLFQDLHGRVVEIGPGTGINLNYLSGEVSEWIGVEPNEAFHQTIREQAEARGIKARLVNGDADHIPLPDDYADAVIVTLVLCSVPDPSHALAEIKRVLKPGGRLVFIEHVAAREKTMLRKAQDFLNPVNRMMADGCNCNRETWKTIEDAGFTVVRLEHEKINAIKLHSPHIMGYAEK